MKKVGFLGCGKIGGAILRDILEEKSAEISFIQVPVYKGEPGTFPVIQDANPELLKQTDLVIEAAMADVLKANAEEILKYCDLMMFSVTALADPNFYEKIMSWAEQYRRTLYLPHGAILGIDGIADGKNIIRKVSIETVKSPKSLGRTDTERAVVFEGCTREACFAYPRSVNVHASVALAGIGFDKTCSRIVSDPAVETNVHKISVEGDGINFEIMVSSSAGGGVTGKYTPYSAVSSARKVICDYKTTRFV